MKKTQLNFWF